MMWWGELREGGLGQDTKHHATVATALLAHQSVTSGCFAATANLKLHLLVFTPQHPRQHIAYTLYG